VAAITLTAVPPLFNAGQESMQKAAAQAPDGSGAGSTLTMLIRM
jgi:hypothetical protein